MDRECSRCNVPHRAQIAGLPDVGFEASGGRDRCLDGVATLLHAEVEDGLKSLHRSRTCVVKYDGSRVLKYSIILKISMFSSDGLEIYD